MKTALSSYLFKVFLCDDKVSIELSFIMWNNRDIMKTEKFRAESLKGIMRTSKVCTLDEMMTELGTRVRKTMFRKLAELEYQTSYSHHGKYYALKSTCRFNESGLWTFREAWFSVQGTLLETAREFVERSKWGYSVEEMSTALHLSSKQALLTLENRGLVARQKFSGVFVYFSMKDERRRQQVEARQSEFFGKTRVMGQDVLAHELKAAIVLFFSLLDERQRRLFAGIEAMKLGKGGDAAIAGFLGVDPHTVARGRNELLNREIHVDRLRRPGAGRKKLEKKLRK